MFVSIRHYSGCPDAKEVNRRVVEKLIPTLKAFPGYVSYSVVDCGNKNVMSISTFETRDNAESATAQVRDLVQSALADLLPNPPEVIIGELLSESRR